MTEKTGGLRGLNRDAVFLAVIMAVGAALILANLTDRPLWQDEAGTALVSKTVLKYGYPRGFDGTNYLSQLFGVEYGVNYMWRWHGWATFYIQALSFAALGATTLAARLPSAVFGIADILLIFILCRRLFADKKSAFIAAILLALCVPHMLLARQARYFTLEMMLALAALCAYAGDKGLRRAAGAAYFISVLLLFHVIHVNFFILTAAVCAHAAFFDRGKAGQAMLLSGAALAVNLPFLFTIYAIGTAEAQPAAFIPGNILSTFLGFFASLYDNLATLPVLLAAAAGVVVVIFAARKWGAGEAAPRLSGALLMAFLICADIVVMSVASGAPDFRQLALAVPAVIVLLALCVTAVYSRAAWAGVLALALAVSGWRLPDYLYEITHRFNSGTRAACRYISGNASKDDVVATPYSDMPLKFYTGLKVINPVTGEELSGLKDADWVLLRPYSVMHDGESISGRAEGYIRAALNPAAFERVVIDAPDLYSENRECLKEHLFRVPSDAPKTVIFHRVKRP